MKFKTTSTTHMEFDNTKYNILAYKQIPNWKGTKFLFTFIKTLLLLGFIILFLPWTQNINTQGTVIALDPSERPQNVQTPIAGRIEKWYVKEGDYVKKGDTLVYITEVKDKYLDPNLIKQTQTQIAAKMQAAESYINKAKAIDQQIASLKSLQKIKLMQAQNYVQQALLKVQSDSIDFIATKTNLKTEEIQLKRTEELYKQGLKSLTELEIKRQKYQEALAKNISQENKLLSSKNQYINALADLNAIKNDYNEKLSKAESDKNTALSNLFDTESSIAKMENELSNITIRNTMYYIKAPQNGYVTKVTRTGVGEIMKENDVLLTIMPEKYTLGAEFYVEPIDLPLLKKGQHLQVYFDGWPSIIFSGWPGVSHGTFEAEITAIDQYISENGKYRILAKPKTINYPWPDALRVGSGAKAFILLKEVPIWYELWRKFNGFPPDFYNTNQTNNNKDKK